ncbi:MAG: adenine methyltransferase [Actinobacteria bacterium]|nr:adenine methyltransferase [Actinomycetota bacterium]
MEQQERTSDDYYTPKWVFDRLGLRFDLDVCAPPGGGPFVPCDRYYTMADDGLTAPWHGRVWMNPPYSGVRPWWERFAAHRNGVALLPLAKSGWLSEMWTEADGVALLPNGGKVEFVRPGSAPAPIWLAVVVAAFGQECVEALRGLGTVRVALPYDPEGEP